SEAASVEGVDAAATPGGSGVRAVLARHPGQPVEATLAAEGFVTREVPLPGIAGGEGVRLLLATSLGPLRASLAQLERNFALVLLAGLLVAGLLAYLLSR